MYGGVTLASPLCHHSTLIVVRLSLGSILATQPFLVREGPGTEEWDGRKEGRKERTGMKGMDEEGM